KKPMKRTVQKVSGHTNSHVELMPSATAKGPATQTGKENSRISVNTRFKVFMVRSRILFQTFVAVLQCNPRVTHTSARRWPAGFSEPFSQLFLRVLCTRLMRRFLSTVIRCR